jgi:hypothetical protein
MGDIMGDGGGVEKLWSHILNIGIRSENLGA